ncbi:MAG: hypothetical protein RDU59_08650 [Thermodesulfobacteriota bacterium]|nr:hypothetical protein [Thermodesulfobacteriota bacterium]
MRKLWDGMAAASFAEAGEFETARQTMDKERDQYKKTLLAVETPLAYRGGIHLYE